MKATKITDAEIEARAIASLPTRPTAPTTFGGRGYTATEMTEAFDKLPRLVAERLNDLIGDIQNGNIAEDMPTGITGLATLSAVYESIADGSIAAKLKVEGEALPSVIASLQRSIELIASRCGVDLSEVNA